MPKRHEFSKDVSVANNCMKIFSTLLITKEFQVTTTMRYHVHPLSLKQNHRKSQVLGYTENPCALLVWMYGKMGSHYGNDVAVVKKFLMDFYTFWFSNSTLEYIPKITKNRDSNRYLYTHVHSIIIHNIQKVEANQVGEWKIIV